MVLTRFGKLIASTSETSQTIVVRAHVRARFVYNMIITTAAAAPGSRWCRETTNAICPIGRARHPNRPLGMSYDGTPWSRVGRQMALKI